MKEKAENPTQVSNLHTIAIFQYVANSPIVQGMVIGDLSTQMDSLFTEEQERSLRKTIRNLLISGYIPETGINLNEVNFTDLTKKILSSFLPEIEQAAKIGDSISSSPSISEDDEESMYNY